jgi:hypothetical protein
MHQLKRALAAGLVLVLSASCGQSAAPTAPTPSAPAPTPITTSVLTLEPDTGTPVGQAVAITFASRAQEAGKITVAVTGFNLQNQITPTVVGVSTVAGRLKWDDALLELDAIGAGDMFGGNAGANFGRDSRGTDAPGEYPFVISRIDLARVTGSGELFLLRLRPRPGVNTGTSRIELVPIRTNDLAEIFYMTPLLMSPYRPSGPNPIENAYGAMIRIRPS